MLTSMQIYIISPLLQLSLEITYNLFWFIVSAYDECNILQSLTRLPSTESNNSALVDRLAKNPKCRIQLCAGR